MRRTLLIGLVLVALLVAPASAVGIARITVATTATLIYTAPLAGNSRVLVRNPGAVSVYVGPAGVLTSTGFEIVAGDAMSINISYGDTLYGVVASGTQVVYTISGANPQ